MIRFSFKCGMAILCLSFVFFWSCGTKNGKEQEAEMPAELPEDFRSFFYKFHEDTLFQMQSIVFPLAGKKRTGAQESGGDEFWTEATWTIHKPFKDEEGVFEREYITIGTDLVIEHITLRGGKIGMERRFSKMGGKWYLIYYSGMNMLGAPDLPEEDDWEEED